MAWIASGLGFSAVLLLMMLGMPIATSMLLVGFAGIWLLMGEGAAFGMMGQVPFNTTLSYELSVVPMFILMGAIISRTGMAADLYRLCHSMLGHLRGGLAMATIVACGGFSAVCGSSIATAATMAKVAIPEMRDYRYGDGFAAASVAAGGTLGILIPPSVIMVLYGIATGTDIGQLFIAGILPGALAVGLYLVAVWYHARVHPSEAPAGRTATRAERMKLLAPVSPVLLLFLLIIGGLYFGLFTPTEAAGVGAGCSVLIAAVRRVISWADLGDALVETVRTTASLFLVLIGALVFSNFVNLAGLPEALSGLIKDLGLSPLGVILVILVIYVVLGMFMESLSMILLTIPVFFPIISAQGFDPVWFGIFAVMVTELSLITPPVGLNLFVIRGVIPGLPIGAIYRGILPFVAADLVRIGLIIAFPAIVLWLPSMAAP
jgi:tripartite ATP-independent transporter DctM subunit